mmetsp:Transcript_37566/g.42289  ORF Transcript_37566/g.42289 Transcript_37566/m.42289 type:complete len:616 (+) Transcript_37566:270-2117(+)
MKLFSALLLLLCQQQSCVVNAGPGQQKWMQVGGNIDGENAQDWAGGTEKGMAMNGAGTTIAVGSSGHDGSNDAVNSGHVRVFDLDDTGNWLLRGDAIEGEFAYDNSGTSVVLSADGMILGIGEPQSDAGKNTDDRKQIDFGQVRVFEWKANKSKWAQRGEAITGETKYDFASDGGGLAMDASGTTIVIGAPFHDGDELYSKKGQVRVFDWEGTNWIQRGADLLGEAAGDLFGEAVAINGSGDTVAVGALHNDGEAEAGRYGCVACHGSVRIFDWSSSGEEWLQRGNDIDGEQDKDFFGSSVALNAAGNMIVIGAPQTGDSSKRGLAYVYKWDNEKERWQKRGSCIEGTDGGDVFGSSVSISNPGETIAVGAYLHDGKNGDNDGHVRVFDWNKDTESWSQRGEDIEGENKYDTSGYSVALSADGKTVASGARDTDDGAGYQAGHVRVFGWKNDDGEPTSCDENIGFAPVCEGIEYDNRCIAKEAGFMETQCFEFDGSFCLDDVDRVWCQGSINIVVVEYSNLCQAMLDGYRRFQCTGQDPSTPDECEDDELFRKGNQNQNCAEYLENKGKRRCKKGHQGKKVYDFCVKTCNDEFGLGDCTTDEDDDSDDYNFELDN